MVPAMSPTVLSNTILVGLAVKKVLFTGLVITTEIGFTVKLTADDIFVNPLSSNATAVTAYDPTVTLLQTSVYGALVTIPNCPL